ncbi:MULTISPECIES: hypothetical protein [Amycolatopsis]|uniref:ESX-1 secretion-associated protein EspA/EspE-like domain-containing protein n=1 Tax=Amycolatopsis dendrobii TaxID=2760662 RepID=A0A7W3VYA5_9PSEU|nr:MULTISPECIES: hypothetical protein [Amycolatopsis]MBB1155468.1 hypothetical protein [Amycolatopsis dendrobii]UKD54596.1 hypothetical protein L3Q65_43190 [Amycolatopsis sp. FU40]
MTSTDSGQLLAHLKSTAQAVENHDWVSAGLGGATTALDLLGASQDPLAALTSAGFGMITELVRFLEEPLKQLQGNPDSVSSHSQGMEGGGQQVSSVADDYRQSAGPETSGWSGSSASSYRDNSSQHADCVEAVGQAGIAMAKAATGAGKVVAKAQQEVGGLISEAVGQIIQLMTQAFAAAQATFGASIAAAIPQAVAIATQYGGQIAQKLGVLLSDSDNLLQLITSVTQGLEAATQLMTKLSEASKSSSGEEPGTGSSSDSRYPAQYASSSESQYPASEYSDSDSDADSDSSDSQYPGQHRPRTPVSTARQS